MTRGLFHGEAFPPSAMRIEGKGIPSPESSGGRDECDCPLLSYNSRGWHIELPQDASLGKCEDRWEEHSYK